MLQPTDADANSGVKISYTAQQFRALIGAVAVPGVSRWTDLKVSPRAAGANMSVDVSAGECVVAGTSIAYQGSYYCQSTATTNVPLATAPTSGTRTDLILAQVYDKQADGGTQYAWTVTVATGTTTAPANSLVLARVAVSANATSITSTFVTDVRTANLLVDRPQWQLKGGNGQQVPHGANTTYTGWTFSNLQFVSTNGNPGEIVVRQPGQYFVSYTGQMDFGGTATALRRVYVDHLSPAGTFIERIGQQDAFPGAGLTGAPGPAQTASGMAVCAAGDILRARSYQASTATLHLYDADTELRFTGSFSGPAS